MKGAQRLNEVSEPLYDLICFHCQQAAEKYLKAFLQELGLNVPKTHNLDQLLALLLPHDGSLRPLRRGLSSLTKFAVDYRYPDESATSRKAQAALRCLDRVRRELRTRLGLGF